MEDKRFALLIDADNISAKYIAAIIDEMTKYGSITYKRLYSDWTNNQTVKWKRELLEYSITPIQQFSNTVGKNATDSALIIDAMDILYTDSVEGFCIVSSDSDFTRLAARLRESGMEVIGMGEEKTPRSFRSACNVFTTLENLLDQDNSDSDAEAGAVAAVVNKQEKETGSIISKKTVEDAIIKIIAENENNGKATGLAQLGNRLVKMYSDFDVRNYGYSSLSKFLEEMHTFKLRKVHNVVNVELSGSLLNKAALDRCIQEYVRAQGSGGADLGILGQKIHDGYINFNVKNYGYSTFAKFVQSVPNLEVKEDSFKIKRAYYCPSCKD
ncbi:MAG: NYN domain-containing protein [Bacillota bacterium]